MSASKPPNPSNPAREKFLGLSLESTRKSYYPQLQAQLSALRENEARLRLLADSLPARISFVDADQRYQFVNREYERALDLPREAIVGRHLREVLGTDNYRKIETHVSAALSGRPVRFEVMFTKKGGGPIWLEASYVPYAETGGAVAGFYDLTQDLTERKRAEDALRESEAKYRELVQHAPAGIYEFDLENVRFTSVNDVMCRYTGYTEEELLSLDPYTLLAEDSRSTLDQLLGEVFAGHANPRAVEYSIRTKDGRTIRVLVNSRFFFEDGRPKRAMAVAHDVTAIREAEQARRQLEVKLQEAQKMESLGTLAGGIAHDFNNLLMGIQGNASLAMLDFAPGDPHYQQMKHIDSHVQRGVSLTRQLLGLARGGKYEVRPADMNALVDTSADLFGRTRKEIQIRKHLQKGIWTVAVDRGQIEQVLLNLFINAWHAMPHGGDLVLTTRNETIDENQAASLSLQPGRYVCVSVADTGTGIDPAVRQKIFDPFFTTKAVGEGTGLGLASAYGIIKNHQGCIEVDSQSGRGSTFAFYLPASDQTLQPARDTVERLPKGSETVLLVDDEATVLSVGAQLLNRLGYTVITADSGKAALDVYGRRIDDIDLVILDMIMPRMGGSETFDRLKTLNPAVKVLLSSGYSVDGQATRILERGCNGFIQKPFSFTNLAAKIRAILD